MYGLPVNLIRFLVLKIRNVMKIYLFCPLVSILLLARVVATAQDCELFVFLGSDTTLCSGDTLELKYIPPADSVNWVWSNGMNDTLIQITDSGTYYIDVFSTNCIATDSIVVNFIPLPIVLINADTVCSGSPTIFNNSSEYLPLAAFTWDFGDGTSSIDQSSHVSHIYAGSGGTFWASLTINHGFGCVGQDSINVLVNRKPLVETTAETVCETSPTIFLSDITNTLPGYMAFLYPQGGSDPIDISSNPTEVTQVYSQSGNYQAFVIVDNLNGCSDTAFVDLEVLTIPNASFVGLQSSYCAGDMSDTLRAATPGGMFTGENLDFLNDSMAIFKPEIPILGTITYEVSSSNGCSNQMIMEVVVNALPTVDLGNDTMISPGQSLVLINSVSAPDFLYLWSNGAITPTLTIQNPGYYLLQVTIAGSGCFAADTILVELNTPDRRLVRQPYQISIFPNPARDYVWVKMAAETSGQILLRLISSEGRILEEKEITAIADQPLNTFWALSHYPPGIYYIEVNRSYSVPLYIRN